MKLFEPIQIKDMKLKNRIVMPPMCMYSATDGMANDFHIIHYATRAMGQMGLIILESTGVLENGQISNQDLGIWKDEQIKPLSWVVNRVKGFGSMVGIQLNHAGRRAHDTENRFAPSMIAFGKMPLPKAMSIDDIEDVKKAFKEGARRCLEAGFDFIEIHAAHGYLLHSFLSPLSNHRTDKYGGSLENRSRLLYEVIEEVRSVWPLKKPLGIRISYYDYDLNGLHAKDLVEVINGIEEGMIDVVNVSTGGILQVKVDDYPGYQLPGAKAIKKATQQSVIAGGLINDASFANNILKENEADLIYFGRLSLKDPYFPLRFSKLLGADIPWMKQYERAK